MAYSVVEPPMKRRFFAGPPKVTLETRCGTNIRPSNSPPALAVSWFDLVENVAGCSDGERRLRQTVCPIQVVYENTHAGDKAWIPPD
jgi:hypothetical protein